MKTQNLICGPVEIFEVGEPMNMETIREHCEGRKDPVICLTLAALEEIVRTSERDQLKEAIRQAVENALEKARQAVAATNGPPPDDFFSWLPDLVPGKWQIYVAGTDEIFRFDDYADGEQAQAQKRK